MDVIITVEVQGEIKVKRFENAMFATDKQAGDGTIIKTGELWISRLSETGDRTTLAAFAEGRWISVEYEDNKNRRAK